MSMPNDYYSYMVRIWRIPMNEGHTYRILLENIQTGERCNFENLEEMTSYLQRLLETGQIPLIAEDHS